MIIANKIQEAFKPGTGGIKKYKNGYSKSHLHSIDSTDLSCMSPELGLKCKGSIINNPGINVLIQ